MSSCDFHSDRLGYGTFMGAGRTGRQRSSRGPAGSGGSRCSGGSGRPPGILSVRQTGGSAAALAFGSICCDSIVTFSRSSRRAAGRRVAAGSCAGAPGHPGTPGVAATFPTRELRTIIRFGSNLIIVLSSGSWQGRAAAWGGRVQGRSERNTAPLKGTSHICKQFAAT